MAESEDQSPMSKEPLNGELLSAYLDGELTAEEHSEVETRLLEDEQAREMLDQLRSASEAVRSLPPHTLGIDLRELVLQRAQVQPWSQVEPRSSTLEDSLDYNTDIYEANDHGSGRRIVYAAAAIAAALLLMFYQGGENPAGDQVAMSGDNSKAGAPDTVIRGANSENTQIAGMGGLGAMFSSRQNKNEVTESEFSTIPSPSVELIGDQLLGDAPLEHLHVHLKPKAGAAQEGAFAQLLEDSGITQMNSPASTASSEGYRAQMILVDAPLLQIRKILLHSQSDDSDWTTVNIRRQSDAAPALSFFAAEDGALESLGNWLSLQGSTSNAWALYLGRGTEAAVPSAAEFAASDSAEDESAVDATADPRLDANRGNLRVLFVLLPAGE